MIIEIGSLIAVAFLWGGTNPFLKRGSEGVENIKSNSKIKQLLLEMKYLFTNPKYVIPLALNQFGSVLYFLTLQNVDLSIAVPVANSLTFVFTALSGWLLGEQTTGKRTYFGMILVLTGTAICCWDKYQISR